MTAREAVYKSLGEYRRNKLFTPASEKILENPEVSERDKALAWRIFLGVLQNMSLCDFYAESYSTIGIKKVEPRALDILRLSIYQIVFLKKIPHSAAVNEGVALARKHLNTSAAGYVNALLRRVADAVAISRLPEPGGETARRLSVKYSHPRWLVREIVLRLGAEGAEAFFSSNNSADMPFTAQVNTLKADMGNVLSLLNADGFQAAPHPWLDDCIQMRRPGKVETLNAFIKGYIYIQDPASRLAVIAAGPKPGDTVLDGCSAPGGKAFATAIAMGNTGSITACDIKANKLRLIEDGARRLGISIIKTLERDSSIAEVATVSANGALYDIVLADVPCSGVGVIRRKPDIRYKDERDIEALPEIQRKLITGLSKSVKPGGVLVYSTCTVLKNENEDVVGWFLNENAQFSAEAFVLPGIGEIPGGMTTLWPHIHGTDGFFICKLRKKLRNL